MKVSRGLPFLLFLIFTSTLLPAQQETEIDWVYEINLLGKELAEKHADLFFKTDSLTFNRELRKIASEAPGQSLLDVSILLQQVLARMGDSHTQINYHFNVDSRFILPIDCYWFEEGIFILRSPQEYEQILGKKVVSINDYPIQQVIDSLTTLIVYDNRSMVKNLVPRMITWAQILEHFGFADHQGLELTVEDQKGEKRHSFITLPVKDGKILHIQPDSIPFGFRDQKAYFRDHYFPADKLYYIQYNRCWSREVEEKYGSGASALFMPSFKEFEKEVKQVLKKKEIDKFVFDMRFNSGGNPDQGTRFIRKLLSTKIKGDGDFYVVVGRKTFSSAIINTVDFLNNPDVLSVGEETGGRPNHFGEVKRFVLPESRLVVNYSTKYFTLVQHDIPSIVPELAAPISFSQYMHGIDPVLEVIRAHP
ncbi:MAG: hypothetical protein ABFS28_00265 [Bacteroidota bacterium]